MNKCTFLLGLFFVTFSVGGFAQDDVVEGVIPIDEDWYSRFEYMLASMDEICDPEWWDTQDSYRSACDN